MDLVAELKLFDVIIPRSGVTAEKDKWLLSFMDADGLTIASVRAVSERDAEIYVIQMLNKFPGYHCEKLPEGTLIKESTHEP